MPQSSFRPNVLFLFSDEHSFRYMGHCPGPCFAEAVDTPNFDRLAARGAVFRDAYCAMPLCTPSRICTLTGLEVRRCGAWTNESVLRPGLITWPETFAAAGYETVLVGKMHLGGNRQFVGFRHRPYGDLTGKCGHQWEPLDAGPKQGIRARTVDAGVSEIPESLIQDNVVAQETVAFLREHRHRAPGQPWFACASFSRPHFPLTAPRRWFERYWPDGVGPPAVPAAGDAFDHPMSVGMRRGFAADAIGREEMLRARAAYAACVSYLDEVIGDLLLRLEADGLLENTIVVYSSDHGELAGEHGVWWKNGWYEGCTRVPLIVSLPEQRRDALPPRSIHTPVSLLDLFPTCCDLAGIPVPPGLNGRSLAGTLREGGEPAVEPVCCDALVPRWGRGTEFRSVRLGNLKYVRFRAAPPLLFDLAEDPCEQRDLLRRGIPASLAKQALAAQTIAENTLDFSAAEDDRLVRDGALHETFRQDLPTATPNLYIMPSGRLINADDALYHPTVIAPDAASACSDWPVPAGEASCQEPDL
ncbi:MAG: sulfatase-like hydrolase/transferase [Lentisphaeria bacterium]|nr:sulfatase-like hydrolase/transferase [Lentisphaeria bacterium]